MLFKLAIKSLLDRKTAVLLTIASISLGVFMLISFIFIKDQVKSSFTKTVSGIDLIVGTKTSEINLLLYSVFQIGTPANNIDWGNFELLQNDPAVDWAIPVSLGDSHKGFRVVGTSEQYFKHFKFGKNNSLQLSSGSWFEHNFGVVLGQDVAQKLGYIEGDTMTLSHGVSQTSFNHHDEAPFVVHGILKKTGTPVDQSLYVSLTGIEAVHLNWPNSSSEQQSLRSYIEKNALPIKSITSAFIGLKNKSSTFVMQRKVNDNTAFGLMAVLPGVALAQMWRMSSFFENILILVGFLILVSNMMGLFTMLVSSLQTRKKELALLRIIGASPSYCLLLILIESLIMLVSAIFLACVSCLLGLFLFDDLLGSKYGLFFDLYDFFSMEMLSILSGVFVIAITLLTIPSMLFYKQSSLKDLN